MAVAAVLELVRSIHESGIDHLSTYCKIFLSDVLALRHRLTSVYAVLTLVSPWTRTETIALMVLPHARTIMSATRYSFNLKHVDSSPWNMMVVK